MTEAKSTQPQLPPRPKYMRPRNFDPADFVFGYEETNKYMKALEAENESLKAQIVQGDGSCDHCGKVPSIVMPTSLCDDCADGVKRAEKAEAERDKLLDVVRDIDSTLCACRYDNKPGCNCDIHAAHRLADALLYREPKEN